MASHISSEFFALFSTIFLFLVFHISQIVKPGRSSHKRFTILFLKLLVGHSAMVRSGLPLCLWSLLKMVTPLSHKELATLHLSNKWLIVSSFSSHIQQRDGPWKPLTYKLSQVRMRHLITSQQKIETLGHRPPFHISQIVKAGRSSHKGFTILFLKLLVGYSVIVRSSLPLCLLSLLKMVTPLSHKAVATLHSSSKWLIVSPFSSHKQHRDGPIKLLACKLS